MALPSIRLTRRGVLAGASACLAGGGTGGRALAMNEPMSLPILGGAGAIAWSDNGKTVAALSIATSLTAAWDAGTGQPLFSISGYRSIGTGICFVPGSSQLLSTKFHRTAKFSSIVLEGNVPDLISFAVLDARSGAILRLVPSPDVKLIDNPDIPSIAADPHGRFVALIMGGGVLHTVIALYDTATWTPTRYLFTFSSTETQRLSPYTFLATPIRVSQDGKYVALLGEGTATGPLWHSSQVIALFDVSDARVPPRYIPFSSEALTIYRGLAFSPDSKSVVVSEAPNANSAILSIIRLEDGSTTSLHRSTVPEVCTKLLWCPVSGKIYTSYIEKYQSAIYVWDAALRERTLLLRLEQQAQALCLSPDGTQLAYGTDHSVEIIRV